MIKDPFGQEDAMNKALVVGIGFVIAFWLHLDRFGLL